MNGLSLIKINAKLPDIRLQTQAARLLATFSSVKDYVDWLNNDEMYALLFLLAENAWRIGGDTEMKPDQNKSDNTDQPQNANDNKELPEQKEKEANHQ
eukprot:CAMPEP_0201578658 /NCGR_PEP_ID=MMETSP0190_2-20130828/25654_1 /ASSEMBLY_ACC=CAM_ASM_000263 /TAXON_ID=37353 /ORGANISM="Rosalina sp." /LENGTH=97 /DNA_ID=CAMNT_0048012093 /DNA_START=158 /DNA_END=448 /DNA_ORIENTATION=+